MKNHILAAGISLALMMSPGSHAQQLTQEQQGKLLDIGVEFIEKGAMLESQINGKLAELALELQRKGRLDSQKEADKSAKRTNAILKDISGLYGQFIKTKVELLLKAKNVLTLEQKLYLLSQIDPHETLPYESIEYMQPDIFDLPLNLDLGQREKLVKLEADLMIKEIKLECDAELILLKLENLLISGEANPDKVDTLVMKLADLATKAIDNRVGFFLEAKDVLTLDQKRLLAYLMGLE